MGVRPSVALEEDRDLRLINAKKLAEMKRRAGQAAPPSQPKAKEKVEKSSREVVAAILYDRGDEVLETAYAAYPREMEMIVDQIAKFVKDGKLTDGISGGELYSILRELGMRFSLNTSIRVQDRGRLVDLKDKLRSDREREAEEAEGSH